MLVAMKKRRRRATWRRRRRRTTVKKTTSRQRQVMVEVRGSCLVFGCLVGGGKGGDMVREKQLPSAVAADGDDGSIGLEARKLCVFKL